MSTKIYSGFKACNLTTTEWFNAIERLSKECTLVANRLLSQFTINTFVTQHDLNLVHDNPEEVSLRVVRNEIRQRQREIKKTGLRDIDIDFDFSISFAPVQNEHNNWIGIAFTEQEELQSLLEKQEWFAEFGYWNNTDGPDDVSEEAWELRSNTWDAHIPSGVPQNHMASFVLVSNDELRFDLSLTTPPSDSERMDQLARQLSWKEYIRNVEGNSQNTSEFFGHFLDFGKGYKPDGKFWSMRDKYMPKIREFITKNPTDVLLVV